jgi:galactose mutarotase-like enzyme
MQGDPFSHGIGRYAPWQWRREGQKIVAGLKGSDRWRGSTLAELEGTDFVMQMEAELKREGLYLTLHVEAERLSVVGLHYYYALPPGPATVSSRVQPLYNDMGVFKPMQGGEFLFDLEREVDYGFLPENGKEGEILLRTTAHTLKVCYQGAPDAVSWQLYHPKDASFVCIEPMSVKNPRDLNTSKSSLRVQIDVIPN